MSERWLTRPEAPNDIASVRSVVVAAFPTADEADLVDSLRRDPAWIDGLSMVAVDAAGAVVGHALLTRCFVDEVEALCLAPCAVRPDVQRQGVGTAVITAAIEAARALGESLVIVLGHPAYYPRFGFRRASEAGIQLSIDVPDDALMVLSLDGAPVPTGMVKYAGPFGIS